MLIKTDNGVLGRTSLAFKLKEGFYNQPVYKGPVECVHRKAKDVEEHV